MSTSSSVTITGSHRPSKRTMGNRHDEHEFEVTFMQGIIRKCYGCGRIFAARYKKPPHDIIRKCSERREYRCQISGEFKQSNTLSYAYYHLNINCVKKRHPRATKDNVFVNGDIKKH